MDDIVSIIIPVYNGANYLKCAIDSALDQTYPYVEVVVVNDGSNDDGATSAIARSYGSSIVYIEKKNGGVSSALNAGIDAMHGSWFSWLSHDDVYSKGKIASQIGLIEKYGARSDGMRIAYCGNNYIDKEGNLLTKKQRVPRHTRIDLDSNESLLLISRGYSIGGCNLLIPRHAFDNYRFDENLRYVQDNVMWANLFRTGYKLLYKPEDILVSTRIHAQQGQSTLRYLWQSEVASIAASLVPALAKLSDGRSEIISYMLRCYGKGNWACGEYARRFLEGAGWMNFGLDGRVVVAKGRGHAFLLARSAYHRIAHGFVR